MLNITHAEFVSINNVLKEYDTKKEDKSCSNKWSNLTLIWKGGEEGGGMGWLIPPPPMFPVGFPLITQK